MAIWFYSKDVWLIYRHFDDFEPQKYHFGDMMIYALIWTTFENEKFFILIFTLVEAAEHIWLTKPKRC